MGDGMPFSDGLETFSAAGGGSPLSDGLPAFAEVPPLRVRTRSPTPAEEPPDVLARIVESEILPRLMMAHRRTRRAAPERAPSPEEITAFSAMLLAPGQVDIDAQAATLRDGGLPLPKLLLELLAPAARHLGEMWEDDTCDFLAVTEGLGRLQAISRRLCAQLEDESVPAAGRSVLLLPCPRRNSPVRVVDRRELLPRGGLAGDDGDPWARSRSGRPPAGRLVRCPRPVPVLRSGDARPRGDDSGPASGLAQPAARRDRRGPLFRRSRYGGHPGRDRCLCAGRTTGPPASPKLCWTGWRWPAERVQSRRAK